MAGVSSDSIHVIHVDDEPEFAELAAEFVQQQDPRVAVETATNPVKGLERIRANGAHCVVSDYDMPGQNGIEFLEAVRKDYPDLPFILFTGKGSEEVASDAISSGVTDYLQKESGTSQYEVLYNRIENVVEQHRAEAMVEEAEQRLQTIAENTDDMLWKFTPEWDELLFVNSAYEDIWGRSIDELRSQPKSFLDGVHTDDTPDVREAMAKLSAGESVDLEVRVNPDEGFSRWAWIKGEPVHDDQEEVVKVVGFARDISERKIREKALSEHRAKLRVYERAVESSTDLLGAVDTEYNLLFANKRYREYHGLSPEDVNQTALPDYLGEKWERKVKPRLDRTLRGETLRYEMQRDPPDDVARTLDIRYYPLRDDEDTIMGAVAAMRDVSTCFEQEESIDGA